MFEPTEKTYMNQSSIWMQYLWRRAYFFHLRLILSNGITSFSTVYENDD